MRANQQCSADCGDNCWWHMPQAPHQAPTQLKMYLRAALFTRTVTVSVCVTQSRVSVRTQGISCNLTSIQLF